MAMAFNLERVVVRSRWLCKERLFRMTVESRGLVESEGRLVHPSREKHYFIACPLPSFIQGEFLDCLSDSASPECNVGHDILDYAVRPASPREVGD